MNRFFFGKRGEIATMITILVIGIVSMMGILVSKINENNVSTSSKAQQQNAQCVDSDGGPIFSQAGKVTYKRADENGTVQTFEYKDKCVKGNGLPGTGVPAFDTVTEYYCEDGVFKQKEAACRDVALGDSCVVDTSDQGACDGETVTKPTTPLNDPTPTNGYTGAARIDSVRQRSLDKSTATYDVVFCGGNQPWSTIYAEVWIEGEVVVTTSRESVELPRSTGGAGCMTKQVTVTFAKWYADNVCKPIKLVAKAKYAQSVNHPITNQVPHFPFDVKDNKDCIPPTATPTQTPTATPMPDATATPVPPAVCTYDSDSYICTDLKDGVCDITKLVKDDGFKNEFLKADGQPNTLAMKDGQTSVHYPTANLPTTYTSYVKLLPPTTEWEITSTYCKADGTGVCPANAGQPVDKLDSFKVACGAIYNYGWVIKKKSTAANKTYQLDLYDSTRPDGTDDRTCWAAADTKDGTNNNIRTADFSNYACSGAVDGKVNKLTASYTNKTSGTVKVRWQINSCDGTLGENDNKCEKNPISASNDFLIDVPAGKKLTCDWKDPNTINHIDEEDDCTITDAGTNPPPATNTPNPQVSATPIPQATTAPSGNATFGSCGSCRGKAKTDGTEEYGCTPWNKCRVVTDSTSGSGNICTINGKSSPCCLADNTNNSDGSPKCPNADVGTPPLIPANGGSTSPPASTVAPIATPTIDTTTQIPNNCVQVGAGSVQAYKLGSGDNKFGQKVDSEHPLRYGEEFYCRYTMTNFSMSGDDATHKNGLCAWRVNNEEWLYLGYGSGSDSPDSKCPTGDSCYTRLKIDREISPTDNYRLYAYDLRQSDNSTNRNKMVCGDWFQQESRGNAKTAPLVVATGSSSSAPGSAGGTSQILTDRTLAVKIDLNDDRSVNIVDYLQAITAMRNNNGTYVKKDGSVVQVNALIISSMIENLGKIVQ